MTSPKILRKLRNLKTIPETLPKKRRSILSKQMEAGTSLSQPLLVNCITQKHILLSPETNSNWELRSPPANKILTRNKSPSLYQSSTALRTMHSFHFDDIRVNKKELQGLSRYRPSASSNETSRSGARFRG